jgi:hypothetical protein
MISRLLSKVLGEIKNPMEPIQNLLKTSSNQPESTSNSTIKNKQSQNEILRI